MSLHYLVKELWRKKNGFFLCFLPLCPSQGTLEITIRQYIRKCNHYKVTSLLVVPKRFICLFCMYVLAFRSLLQLHAYINSSTDKSVLVYDGVLCWMTQYSSLPQCSVTFGTLINLSGPKESHMPEVGPPYSQCILMSNSSLYVVRPLLLLNSP